MWTGEFRCAAHGPFESHVKVNTRCPQGCPPRFVKMEFRTPPSIMGTRTKRADAAIGALASDYGFSDIQGSPSRANSVAEYATRHGKVPAKPHWGDVPHAEPGFSRDKKIPVPTVNAQQYGTVPTTGAQALLAGRKGRGIPTSVVHRAKDD
jgi:hypothetical protein